MATPVRGDVGRKRKTPAKLAAAQRATATLNGSENAAQPSPTIDRSAFAFVPVAEAPKPPRRQAGEPKFPKGTINAPVLRLPNGEAYTQRAHLPPAAVPGMSAIQAAFASTGTSGERPTNHGFDDEDDNFLFPSDHYGPGVLDRGPRAEVRVARHRRRRLQQHVNWNDIISRSLLHLYLDQKYGSRRDSTERVHCQCAQRALEVTLADWDSARILRLLVCPCAPAAEQLLARGYFPCAPLSPSLAFATDLLEFISIHSLNVAPNISAWSGTLEAFWARRAEPSKLHGRLRKRLGMALTWYHVLDNRAEAFVTQELGLRTLPKRPFAAQHNDDDEEGRPRKRARPLAEDTGDEGPLEPHAGRVGARGSRVRGQMAQPQVDIEPETPQDEAQVEEPKPAPQGPAPTGLLRPSERLQQKCPLCFGGARPNFEHTKADVIVCLDANFAQKRRKCADSDPPLEYLNGAFLDDAAVAAMEAELDERRKGPAKRRTKGTAARVADDVLDECEQSFIAAQESVTKASKNYYADTGLMALLCRHDRVLWVVNMTSPGERQHYALALLRKLVQELPADWRLGILYDIACQLSRSIEKWGLLEELLDRVEFAVSVFHAYGHQWPCQVVFHPRKRTGFGLTDGEGCERFWSAIRHLIAGLRVSGFFRRLFVLNRQITSMDAQARWNFGVWLRRRHAEVQRRLAEAAALVLASSVPEAELGIQWDAQVEAQLGKRPRQSARAGDKMLDEILLAMGLVDDLKQQQRDDRKALRKAHKMTATETRVLTTRIEAAARDIESTKGRIADLNVSLGTEQCRRLEELRGNAYLCARVNARALRSNIRANLVSHKFEHRKLERAYRHQVLQAKEHAQTKDLVHRRERNISGQVRKFNIIVDQMTLLARQGKRPSARAPLPRKLDVKKLFKLDVDDDIWQEDPGLGPQGENDVPRWLAEDNVRRGIAALLEKRRCVEELERVQAEVRALNTWSKGEERKFEAFCADTTQDMVVRNAVQRRLHVHRSMRMVWAKDLSATALAPLLDCDVTAPPSDLQTADSASDGTIPAAEEQDSDDASDAYSSGEDEDEPIADFLDVLDAEELAHDDEASVADTIVESSSGHVKSTPMADTNAAEAEASELRAADGAEDAQSASATSTAMEASVLVISDDSDDDTMVRPRGTTRLASYRAGSFICDDLDLERVTQRTAWLSGAGLAVFAQGELLQLQLIDTSVAHSRLLHDVDCYARARMDGTSTEANIAAFKKPIVEALAELVRPEKARKWLVLGHVPSPAHWTLLEVRWQQREIRFYDSFACQGGYAEELERKMRQLLQVCGEIYGIDVGIESFVWIGEKRGVRQTNGWDCGPFVAADAISLMTSDAPSSKTQKDMAAWRAAMTTSIQLWKV